MAAGSSTPPREIPSNSARSQPNRAGTRLAQSAGVSETTAAIPAPKRSKKSLVIIGASAVIALAAIGGGAFWWSQTAQAQTETAAEGHEAAAEEGERGIVAFEPFVVNLADTTASRFLRVKVQLVVEDVEIAEGIEKSAVKTSRARSAILELLTTQTSDVLVTQQGKADLRKAITENISKSLGTQVIDVLFSDFVVQF
jgi:flagellar FliL protein